MHPSSRVEREYIVRTLGMASSEVMQQLVNNIDLDDGPARFEEVSYIGGGEGVNHWYHVTILEGRNREVRRMWEAVGMKVSRLKRVRYGTVPLTSTHRQRAVKELPDKAVIELADSVGMAYSKHGVINSAPRGRQSAAAEPRKVEKNSDKFARKKSTDTGSGRQRKAAPDNSAARPHQRVKQTKRRN